MTDLRGRRRPVAPPANCRFQTIDPHRQADSRIDVIDLAQRAVVTEIDLGITDVDQTVQLTPDGRIAIVARARRPRRQCSLTWTG